MRHCEEQKVFTAIKLKETNKYVFQEPQEELC
jgi:hypothetical protein